MHHIHSNKTKGYILYNGLQKLKTRSYHYKQGIAYLPSYRRSAQSNQEVFLLSNYGVMVCTRLRNHKWTNLSPGNLYLSVY